MEPKRVNLTTISSMAATNTGFSSNQARFGNDLFTDARSSAEDSTAPKQKKTMRLTLELSPTGRINYPEINYTHLMRLEEKKRKKLKQKTNGAASSMPLEENDHDVARIAAELEKKYGTSYGRGRGRSKRDDLCDIGMGYDENDSFIDNTEAYDEVIPEEVETIEGGFYINCGALEFKQLNTETAKLKTDEIIKMPKKSRKRIISSSSSEESSSSDTEERETENIKDNEKTTEVDAESDSSDSTIKSKSNNGLTPKNPKKDKLSNSSKKSSHANGKKKEKHTEHSGPISLSSSNSPKPIVAADEAASDGSDKERNVERQKAVKTTTVKDMLKAKRDSFLKMQVSETPGTVNGEVRGATSKSSDDESDTSTDDDSGTESESNHSEPTTQSKPLPNKKPEEGNNNGENFEKLRSTDTKLPELETELLTNLQSFKELSKLKNITGKRFQFDQELTDVFLRIDESLLCIDKSHRNMVFAHLEYHLTLPRYFFLRKAKQLRIKEEKQKTVRALNKLRKAVIEAMPSVIVSYELEVRKITEMQNANIDGVQQIKMPKKKFPWNSNFRNLLYDVYQTRWISFPVLCTRKESLEDFITIYLKEKVVELWPNGWMRYEDLQKEIDKKKQASKKSKEKKSDNQNGNQANNLLNAQSIVTSTSITTTSGATTATTSASTTPPSNTFAKQFEDFTMNSRSCGNSDTDSVASSGASTSNGSRLKRKATIEDLSNKNKIKSAKLNANLVNTNKPTASVNVAIPSANVIDATSAKSVDNQRNSFSGISNIDNETNKTGSSTFANAAVAANVDKNLKHSSNTFNKHVAHVIDLDEYNSASDILEKSKQLQKATITGNTATTSHTLTERIESRLMVAVPIQQRTNSSDSDGVEIVGVFQANTSAAAATTTTTVQKSRPKKSSKPTMLYNNNNIEKNKLSSLTGGFDINKAVNALKDFELLEQTKPKNSAAIKNEAAQ